MNTFGVILLAVVACCSLFACAPAVTDAQVAAVVARCKELGKEAAIFNSGLVSRVECVKP